MKLSKIISIIFHPVFIPITSVKLTLFLAPTSGLLISIDGLGYIIKTLAFFSILLPIIWSLVFTNFNLNKIEMREKNERVIPLFFTSLFMFLGYELILPILALSPILKSQLFAIIITTFISAIISLFWKISLHMLALGSVSGVVFSLHIIFGDMYNYIALTLIISGIVGVARLYENAHTNLQVYFGFLLGFTTQAVYILLV